MSAIKRILSTYLSGYRWVRKLVGGQWELWWVDSGVNAYVWLHEPRYLEGKNRPGGCAIWEEDPKPKQVETY